MSVRNLCSVNSTKQLNLYQKNNFTGHRRNLWLALTEPLGSAEPRSKTIGLHWCDRYCRTLAVDSRTDIDWWHPVIYHPADESHVAMAGATVCSHVISIWRPVTKI